jgi:hypothetical protein
MENLAKPVYKHYLKTNQYTIRWDKRLSQDSDIAKFFFETASRNPDKPKVTYWIPFRYGSGHYLMTFNNLYEVDVNV